MFAVCFSKFIEKKYTYIYIYTSIFGISIAKSAMKHIRLAVKRSVKNKMLMSEIYVDLARAASSFLTLPLAGIHALIYRSRTTTRTKVKSTKKQRNSGVTGEQAGALIKRVN